MSVVSDSSGELALQWFGRMNASVSHELKNVLAIMNEYAGLLQDYAAMVEHGQPLDVERIQRLSLNLQAQIRRGDDIIKRMNRFAHSADHACATVELQALARLVVELFQRTAVTRGVPVEMPLADAVVNIDTHPFILETLLGVLLDRLTGTGPRPDAVRISMQAADGGAQLRLAGLATQAASVAGVLASADIRALLEVLRAQAGFQADAGELLIALPGTIDR